MDVPLSVGAHGVAARNFIDNGDAPFEQVLVIDRVIVGKANIQAVKFVLGPFAAVPLNIVNSIAPTYRTLIESFMMSSSS